MMPAIALYPWGISEEITTWIVDSIHAGTGASPSVVVTSSVGALREAVLASATGVAVLAVSTAEAMESILADSRPDTCAAEILLIESSNCGAHSHPSWQEHLHRTDASELPTAEFTDVLVRKLVDALVQAAVHELAAFQVTTGSPLGRRQIMTALCTRATKSLGLASCTIKTIGGNGRDFIPRAKYPSQASPTSEALAAPCDRRVTSAAVAESVPMVVEFCFPQELSATGINASRAQQLCDSAAHALRAALDAAEPLRRIELLGSLSQTLRYLPDRRRVLYAACDEMARCVGAAGASLLLITETSGADTWLEKIYVHHGRRDWVDHVSAGRGYAGWSIEHKVALLVHHTYIDARRADAIAYPDSQIEIASGKSLSINYVVAPKTVEDETSVLVCPIRSLSDPETIIAVVKIGEFQSSDYFDVADLRTLANLTPMLAAVIYAAELGSQLEDTRRSHATEVALLEHADVLFYYREIAAGLFHNVGICLNDLEWKLRVMPLPPRSAGAVSKFETSLEQCAEIVANGKSLIQKAHTRGQHLKPLSARCRLIADIVRPAIERANKSLGGVAWKIDHTLGTDDYQLDLDAELMRESLGNVLSNAIWAVRANRHNANKSIRVAVRKDEESSQRVRIDVNDTGIGIAPEALEHVFEMFFTTKGDKGTGLGLYFARRLIEGFGGTIVIYKTMPQKGTTVRIALPIVEDK